MAAGAILEMTPSDVVEQSDITFCCVSDTDVSRKVSSLDSKFYQFFRD